MSTLQIPQAAASDHSSASLLARGLSHAHAWTTEPAMAPHEEGKPLWSELLRFGVHGAALGMVTGLFVVLIHKLSHLF